MTLGDWTARDRPGQWPLVGSRISLEPLNWSRHGKDLFGAIAGAGNDDIWAYMPIGPFETSKAFKSVLSKAIEAFGWETLVFKRRSDGAVVGMSSYMRIRNAHGSVEVGAVAFGPELKRTAEATEAMYLMASHIFDDLGYRRYEWKCHNENQASKRAAERFGFLFEGIFRNDMVVNGQNRDTAWFAMTDQDWPGIKSAFETWLLPSNFNSAGQQV